MFVARNKYGYLQLFEHEPIRMDDYWGGRIDSNSDEDDCLYIDYHLYPNLRWEDEPLEVELTSMKMFNRFIDDVVHMYISSLDDKKLNNDNERINYIQNKMTGKICG